MTLCIKLHCLVNLVSSRPCVSPVSAPVFLLCSSPHPDNTPTVTSQGETTGRPGRLREENQQSVSHLSIFGSAAPLRIKLSVFKLDGVNKNPGKNLNYSTCLCALLLHHCGATKSQYKCVCTQFKFAYKH